jgi:hypothetical protein
VLLALVRVVSTYSEFNHTFDEPLHIAAGLELLDRGTYTYALEQPPLGRVAVALLPFLDGQRSMRHEMPFGKVEGRRILYQGESYQRTLSLARLGNLPFLILALVGVWLWTARLIGPWPAVAAVFFTSTIPPLTGNTAVAALDVGIVGFGTCSLYLACRWLEAPSLRRGALLGAACGAAIMTKFSAIPFLGLCFIALAIWRRLLAPRTARLTSLRARSILLGLATCVFVFWISYGAGVEVVPLTQSIAGLDHPGVPHVTQMAFGEAAIFPSFVQKIYGGLEWVRKHNLIGHQSFLLGEIRSHGWWYFYLVGLGVKTPLPVLVLGVAGLIRMLQQSYTRRDWWLGAPPIAFLAILSFASFFSSINLGVRHLLILYPILGLAAAWTLVALADQLRKRAAPIVAPAAVCSILALQAAISVAAYPDDLAYFNELAGKHPERILMDADLDWGQDLDRLGREVRARGIERIGIAYHGNAMLKRHVRRAYKLRPRVQEKGWIAVSLWQLRRSGDDFAWVSRQRPVARVGKSIDLYYFE